MKEIQLSFATMRHPKLSWHVLGRYRTLSRYILNWTNISEMSQSLSQISMNARKRSSVAPWIGCVRTDQVDMNVYARTGYAWTMMANAFVSIHINKSNYGKARHCCDCNDCVLLKFLLLWQIKKPQHWKSAARSASESRRAASSEDSLVLKVHLGVSGL